MGEVWHLPWADFAISGGFQGTRRGHEGLLGACGCELRGAVTGESLQVAAVDGRHGGWRSDCGGLDGGLEGSATAKCVAPTSGVPARCGARTRHSWFLAVPQCWATFNVRDGRRYSRHQSQLLTSPDVEWLCELVSNPDI